MHGLRRHAIGLPARFCPPRDTDEAIAVLREAVESGVIHIVPCRPGSPFANATGPAFLDPMAAALQFLQEAGIVAVEVANCRMRFRRLAA